MNKLKIHILKMILMLARTEVKMWLSAEEKETLVEIMQDLDLDPSLTMQQHIDNLK